MNKANSTHPYGGYRTAGAGGSDGGGPAPGTLCAVPPPP